MVEKVRGKMRERVREKVVEVEKEEQWDIQNT
jgi:hypothetical protein